MTLTLITGVMNTFVYFLARVISYGIDSFLSKGEERNGPSWAFTIVSLVLDVLLGFLAGMIVAGFSRQREFCADAGAANLMGRKQPMVNALARLGWHGAG